jgi:hypothetical protein
MADEGSRNISDSGKIVEIDGGIDFQKIEADRIAFDGEPSIDFLGRHNPLQWCCDGVRRPLSSS